MEWDKETSMLLIEEYRKREILWNPRNVGYYNYTKKEDAWWEIFQIVNVEVEDLKRKIESLKGSYRREKSRMNKKVTTVGRPKIYISNWFAFESMQFLDYRLDPTPTTAPDFKSQIEENPYTECSSEDEENVSSASTIASSVTKNHRKEEPSKRTSEDGDPIYPETFKYLKQTSDGSRDRRDECDTFGEHVANKIRKFDDHLRAVAQNKICNIIFELEMTLFNQSNSHQELNDPLTCVVKAECQ